MPRTAESPPSNRPLSRTEIKTLGLSALGGALEFYDFVIFVYFAAVIGDLFFPADMPAWLRQVQTFGIFAAGYLVRPLGGLVLAHFGDIAGRKRVFTLSIFLMALPTLLMGCLPTYASAGYAAPIALVLLRLLQGASVGGEVPGAWVFVAEHVPRSRVGLACGALSGGLAGGILLGSLVAAAIKLTCTPDQIMSGGWRIAFILGGVFGLIGVQMRRWLHETPVFERMRTQRARADVWPIRIVLREHWGSVLIAMALTWILSAAIVVVMLMTPQLLPARAPGLDAALANIVATACLVVGCLLAGACLDRFGRRATLAGWSVFLGTSYVLLWGLAAYHPAWLVPLYALAGLAVGITGAIPALAVGLFPAAVRFSGLSLSYNVAYAVFGGCTPIVVSALLHWSVWTPAIYIGFVAFVGVALAVGLRASPGYAEPAFASPVGRPD